MSTCHVFAWVRDGAEPVILGEWRPPGRTTHGLVHITRDRAVAEAWIAELRVGRLPDRPK